MNDRDHRVASDVPFLSAIAAITAMYLLLVVGMLLADMKYTTPADIRTALQDPYVVASIKLTLITCFLTAILSVLVSVPLGYLFSRFRFRGKTFCDTILDIPIVLPPLVIGLSLLILFNQVKFWEAGFAMCALVALGLLAAPRLRTGRIIAAGCAALLACGFFALQYSAYRFPSFMVEECFEKGMRLFQTAIPWERWEPTAFITRIQPGISYKVPAIVLAQFTVSCAFAVRTMRHTFDQISPRHEQVALTLGCNRSQAFWNVVLPEAWRGVLTAGSLAWARALGEFGPILVFAGVTQGKTEVLSTTVFLEFSIGNIEGAVAVSLLMVTFAIVVLLMVRLVYKEAPA